MKVIFVLIVIFINESLIAIPKIRSHHAIIGDYPNLNMQDCGYVSPKDIDEDNTYDPKSRIIEGENATYGEFPWHVFIYENRGMMGWMSRCDGVLIHKFWVITARHCVDDYSLVFGPVDEEPQFRQDQLLLSFGSLDKRQFYHTRNVSLILRYPYVDLALLRLETEINPLLDKNQSFYQINYICLPQEKVFNLGKEEAILSGSGQTEIIPNDYMGQPQFYDLLRKIIIEIDSVSECKRRNYPLYMICAVTITKRACRGDSGAGLVQFSDDNRAILVGIVQNGRKWDKSQPVCSPGILELPRVSYFIRFLRDAIEFNYTLPYIAPKPMPKSTAEPSPSGNVRPSTDLTSIGLNPVQKPDTTTPENGSQNHFKDDKIVILNVIIILIIILIQ